MENIISKLPKQTKDVSSHGWAYYAFSFTKTDSLNYAYKCYADENKNMIYPWCHSF